MVRQQLNQNQLQKLKQLKSKMEKEESDRLIELNDLINETQSTIRFYKTQKDNLNSEEILHKLEGRLYLLQYLHKKITSTS